MKEVLDDIERWRGGGHRVAIARVVAPRFWGGVISMPLLAALCSAMGIFGGYIVGVQLIGVDAGAFWSQMSAAV